ncbi:hypothetical protein [Marinomonas foliarum]|uniref:Uncharacterized protein n=1 Tax=Marinomonas foliarum TaxID=491950 RepID=A0A368ZTR7_9GAMM|nr:hypothetical protein [Marinomonas foliarum]RCX00370.1 hypothetical protein DFP77_12319 [Marinomonas foliarum]
MTIYDEVIIGSGPSSYGYLSGLKNKKKRLLITSVGIELNHKFSIKHVKLSNGNFSHVLLSDDEFPITSSFGGLSNCWGGVLVNGGYEDYISMYSTVNHVSREIYDETVEVLINKLKKRHKIHQINLDNKTVYVMDSDFLHGWENSQLSLHEDISELLDLKSVDLLKGYNVTSLKEIEEGVELDIDGKEKIITKKVVLACGVPGNKKLLESNDVIIDHTPYQTAFISKINNFDQLKIDTYGSPIKNILRINGNYISVYDPSFISDFGVKKISGVFGLLAKKVNILGYKIYFGQVWNENTYSDDRNGLYQRGLDRFSVLKSFFTKRFFLLYMKKTKKGEGFHYQIKLNSHKNIILLGGSNANILPVYHPSFMFIVNAMIEAKYND